ncbi:unnamed protein product [Hymenolepis diminuta]|uniref:Uncharacterized protein n=2 Tax=Hymenolepis diminuta TaxID=6216 RepID=A0A564YEG6_HYMDI|nr:unnamed protein product [Hymenolepis diminuta]
MRMNNSRSQEVVLKDSSRENSPLYEGANVKYRQCEIQSNRYCLPPCPQTTFPSPQNSRYFLNGFHLGNQSDSRKSVRFSEHIGCRQIPCAESQESFVEKLSGKIKSMRSFRISTMVSEANPTSQTQGLLCLPKSNKRHRSFSPIEAAVWNSGRQLRQYIPSPNIFQRITEFPSNFLRGNDSWRSQPSLKSPVGKNKTPVITPPDSAFDMMESVYVSDSEGEYEWETSPYNFEGYENPSNLFSPGDKLIRNQVYESSSPDDDYEFDECVDPRVEQQMLENHDYAQFQTIDNPVNKIESIYEFPPSPKISPKKTALQDRIAQSLKHLSIPEWMQKKVNGKCGSISPKPSSRLPRFPRYIDPSITPFQDDLSKISPLLVRR